MSQYEERERYHDIGGAIGAEYCGPIDKRERELLLWEKKCAALRVTLGGAPHYLIPLDEMRDTFETFGETLYTELSFYERMLEGQIMILVRKDVIAASEVAQRVPAIAARWQGESTGVFTGLFAQSLVTPGAEGKDPYGGRYVMASDVLIEQPSLPELACEALVEILIERGLITADAIRAAIERIEAPNPALGARIVAHAWTDADFRRELIADGMVGAEWLGIPFTDGKLHTVAHSPSEHHLVVCTLCSCYPRNLLGQPPAWYVSKRYRARAVREPRAVLSEFGVVPRDTQRIKVHDSTADMRYLVLPERPSGTEGWDEESLATLVSRDAMIGVAIPTVR
jgi:nitrile hydratase